MPACNARWLACSVASSSTRLSAPSTLLVGPCGGPAIAALAFAPRTRRQHLASRPARFRRRPSRLASCGGGWRRRAAPRPSLQRCSQRRDQRRGFCVCRGMVAQVGDRKAPRVRIRGMRKAQAGGIDECLHRAPPVGKQRVVADRIGPCPLPRGHPAGSAPTDGRRRAASHPVLRATPPPRRRRRANTATASIPRSAIARRHSGTNRHSRGSFTAQAGCPATRGPAMPRCPPAPPCRRMVQPVTRQGARIVPGASSAASRRSCSATTSRCSQNPVGLSAAAGNSASPGRCRVQGEQAGQRGRPAAVHAKHERRAAGRRPALVPPGAAARVVPAQSPRRVGLSAGRGLRPGVDGMTCVVGDGPGSDRSINSSAGAANG